jgi:hypothetical protein
VVAHVVSHFLLQYRGHGNDFRIAMPDRAEGANHEVNQGDVAPPKPQQILELNERLLYLDNFCLDLGKGELHTGRW